MSKTIKLFSIVLIIFSIIFSFYGVYASDIDMNLIDNSINDNEVNQDEIDNSITQDPLNGTTSESNIDSQLSASGVNSIEEDGLSLSNILSILLITVGIILILLSIAIIIRLK